MITIILQLMRSISACVPSIVAVIVTLCLLSGCKKSDTTAPPPPPGGGGTITPQERMAAIKAVQTEFAKLTGNDRNADNQVMLAYLQSRSEFIATGIDRGCVWGLFADSTDLSIVNNIRLLPQPRVFREERAKLSPPSHRPASVEAVGQGIPVSKQVRCLNAYGSGFKTLYNADGNIAPLVEPFGYEVVSDTPTVEYLKNITGDGVFLISTHGAYARGYYGLVTATAMTDSNIWTYNDEMEAGRLFSALVKADQDPVTKEYTIERRYAIKPKFIRDNHWSFSENSFVFMNACDSYNAAFMQECKNAGASVYAGWTNLVDIERSFKTAEFLFNRLVGGNNLFPPYDPPVRPFDYGEIKVEMDKLNYTKFTDPDDGVVELQFSQLQGDFGLMNPSIDHMQMIETNNELQVYGIFGNNDPRPNLIVSIDSIPMTVKSWQPGLIKCTVPVTGRGSAGDVVVDIGGRKSNAAQLTEWRGQFRYTLTDMGSLNQSITLSMHLRNDIRSYYPDYGQPLHTTPVLVAGASDGEGTDSAGGTWTTRLGADNYTESWSGSGTIGQRNPNYYQGIVNMGRDTMFIIIQAPYGLQCTSISQRGSNAPVTRTIAMYINNELFTASYLGFTSLALLMDPTYSIVAGSRTARIPSRSTYGDSATVRLEWDRMEAKFPPNPNSPRRVYP